MDATKAIIAVQLRIIRRDPWFLVIMFGMPLVVMPLFVDAIGLSLHAEGFADASGAEQVVPGQVVLFGFMLAGSAAFSIFREHGWNTWDRLRASAAPPHALLAGFALPWVVIHFTYQLTLLVVGSLLVGLRLKGSVIAELLVVLSYSFCVIALVLFLTATFRTINQVQAFVNLGAMVMGGLGGAIVPVEQLPGWARAISPLTPTYWAMEGHRAVFLESGGLADVAPSVGILFGAAVVLAGLTIKRFRIDETKEFFG
ncbi:MAG: ABC transporter permease [Acidimicrobiales bacterium]